MIDQIAPVGGSVSQVNSVARAGAAASAGSVDFASVIGGMITDAANTVRGAEAASIASIKGQASTQQVVESVMAAEQTLQAAIAIRDKVTAAYLELSRMQI
jgi:flagellar hook-basal body complex protein FliE